MNKLEQQVLENAEDNRDRFLEHLDKISFALNIPWWDGDFPIEEVLEKINKNKIEKRCTCKAGTGGHASWCDLESQ